MLPRRRERHDATYGITTAEGSHLDDISRRQRQYAFTMLFRVAAILVVVFVPGLTVLERLVLGIVATVIPYFAVIRANGGPDNAGDPTNLMIGGPRQGELPATDRGIEGRARYVDQDGYEDPGEDDDRDGDGDGEDEYDDRVYEYAADDGDAGHEGRVRDAESDAADPGTDAPDHV
jgi:hypothetical protein